MPEINDNEAELAESPKEFAQALFFQNQEAAIGLNQSDLRKLVDLAYKVSLSPEEGVYPRFAVFIPEQGQPIRDPTVTFSHTLPLNTQSVKKLGAAIPNRPHALIVQKRDGLLQAKGLIRMEASGLPGGRPEFVMSAVFPGLVVSVDGPGELTAINFCQNGPGIIRMQLFRGGRVLEGHDVLFWKAGLTCLTAQRATLARRQFHGEPRSIGLILEWALSDILAQAVKLRHGGAIVILPQDVSKQTIETTFRIGYPIIDPSFADLAFELVTAPNAELMSRQERLADTTLAVARLTTLDGCVVLSYEFGLLGAGAIIRILENSDLPRCVEARADMAVDQPGNELDLGKLGTRHRSAVWLCKAIPGSLVFVISQDGTIRAFYSLKPEDERAAAGCVIVCAPLFPTVGFSGHQ